MFATSNVPAGVYILQEVEYDHVPGPFLILIGLTWGSSFVKLVFKMFVWFSLTNDSKNLFSILTVLTLFLTVNFPLIAGTLFGAVVDMNLLKMTALIYSTSRFFVIPLEMVLSHSKLRSFFTIKLSFVWSMFKVLFLNILLCIVKLCTSMFNICRSNQVAPINIPV